MLFFSILACSHHVVHGRGQASLPRILKIHAPNSARRASFIQSVPALVCSFNRTQQHRGTSAVSLSAPQTKMFSFSFLPTAGWRAISFTLTTSTARRVVHRLSPLFHFQPSGPPSPCPSTTKNILSDRARQLSGKRTKVFRSSPPPPPPPPAFSPRRPSNTKEVHLLCGEGLGGAWLRNTPGRNRPLR